MSIFHRSFIITVATLLSGCPGSVPDPTDTDGSDTSGSDTSGSDTDPCPGALDREAFIAKEASRFCDYLVTCPGYSEEDRENCMANIAHLYRGAMCFDECEAEQCSAWLDTAPVCTSHDVPLHASCNRTLDCSE